MLADIIVWLMPECFEADKFIGILDITVLAMIPPGFIVVILDDGRILGFLHGEAGTLCTK